MLRNSIRLGAGEGSPKTTPAPSTRFSGSAPKTGEGSVREEYRPRYKQHPSLYSAGRFREAISILLKLVADTSTDVNIQRYNRALRYYAATPDPE